MKKLTSVALVFTLIGQAALAEKPTTSARVNRSIEATQALRNQQSMDILEQITDAKINLLILKEDLKSADTNSRKAAYFIRSASLLTAGLSLATVLIAIRAGVKAPINQNIAQAEALGIYALWGSIATTTSLMTAGASHMALIMLTPEEYKELLIKIEAAEAELEQLKMKYDKLVRR